MPSFVITGTETLSQSLTGSQSGFVAQGATLYVATATPVSITGTPSLTVMGTVASANNQTVLVSATTNFALLVGQGGSLISTRNTAVAGDFSFNMSIQNAGHISGRTGGIVLTNTTGNTLNSSLSVTNSGTLETLGTNAAIRTSAGVTTIVTVLNTGSILSNSTAVAGASGAIFVAEGQLRLTNHGFVSGVIEGGGQTDTLRNLGQISGAINTNDGSDTIENDGTITGNIDLAAGNDILRNTGTINGTVRAGASESAGIGQDVIVNSGTILGNVEAGPGNDSVTNTGTITGLVDLGAGNDVFRNSGTVIGDVRGGNAEPAGQGQDTVVNAGLIDGDVLLGPGNDVFVSEGGRVTGVVVGGAGDDTYFIDDATIRIQDSSGDFDRVFSSVSFQLPAGIEELHLTGGSPGLVGAGNAQSNAIFSDSGNDTLFGRGGNDTLAGFSGDDVLFGGDDNDSLTGGDGDDSLYGGRDSDLLFGQLGDDLLEGGSRNDTLDGGHGDDSLYGGQGDDLLIYGLGANIFHGGAGRDGVDFGNGAGVNANLATGTGIDVAGFAQVLVQIEDLFGSFGDDVLTGDAGANLIEGRGGADVILGGNGADTIAGGMGRDTMTGGGGPDIFVFRDVAESPDAAPDLITDFNRNADVFDVSAIDADPVAAGDQAFTFIGQAAFTGTGAEIRYVRDTVLATTTVEVRLAGAASNSMVIELTGLMQLFEENFVL